MSLKKRGEKGTFPATVTVFGEKFGKGPTTQYDNHQTRNLSQSRNDRARLTSRDSHKYRAWIRNLAEAVNLRILCLQKLTALITACVSFNIFKTPRCQVNAVQC